MGVLKWNEIEKVSSTLFVRQKKQAYMVHDRLFKELIGVFFEDFLEAFFPDVHAQIDFQKITPLSEEVFADLKILHFHYLTLHIRKQNWRLFMKKENPVSAA